MSGNGLPSESPPCAGHPPPALALGAVAGGDEQYQEGNQEQLEISSAFGMRDAFSLVSNEEERRRLGKRRSPPRNSRSLRPPAGSLSTREARRRWSAGSRRQARSSSACHRRNRRCIAHLETRMANWRRRSYCARPGTPRPKPSGRKRSRFPWRLPAKEDRNGRLPDGPASDETSSALREQLAQPAAPPRPPTPASH